MNLRPLGHGFLLWVAWMVSSPCALASLKVHQPWLGSWSPASWLFADIQRQPGLLNFEAYREQVLQKKLFFDYSSTPYLAIGANLDDYINHPSELKREPKSVLILFSDHIEESLDVVKAKYSGIFKTDPEMTVMSFDSPESLYRNLQSADQKVRSGELKAFDRVEIISHSNPGADFELEMFENASATYRRKIPDLKSLTTPGADVVITGCSFARGKFLQPSTGKLGLAQLGAKLLPNGGKIYASEKMVFGSSSWEEFKNWGLMNPKMGPTREYFKSMSERLGNLGISAGYGLIHGPSPHLINHDLVSIDIPEGATTFKQCTVNLIRSVFTSRPR